MIYLHLHNEQEELNSNIRCIEILLEAEHGIAGFGLNSNIRCIEIDGISAEVSKVKMLNSNIRCIEMKPQQSIL